VLKILELGQQLLNWDAVSLSHQGLGQQPLPAHILHEDFAVLAGAQDQFGGLLAAKLWKHKLCLQRGLAAAVLAFEFIKIPEAPQQRGAQECDDSGATVHKALLRRMVTVIPSTRVPRQSKIRLHQTRATVPLSRCRATASSFLGAM